MTRTFTFQDCRLKFPTKPSEMKSYRLQYRLIKITSRNLSLFLAPTITWSYPSRINLIIRERTACSKRGVRIDLSRDGTLSGTAGAFTPLRPPHGKARWRINYIVNGLCAHFQTMLRIFFSVNEWTSVREGFVSCGDRKRSWVAIFFDVSLNIQRVLFARNSGR